MAQKRSVGDKNTVAGHVASKIPKFTRKQGFTLALIALFLGGVVGGIYFLVGKNQGNEKAGNHSQQVIGNDNFLVGNINNARDVIITPKAKARKREVFQNPGSSGVLVLKEIDENPKLIMEYINDKDKHLGFVPVGTEVKALDEKRRTKGKDLVGMGSYTKVEILEGEYKGKVGWVTSNKIRSEMVNE